MEHNGHLLVSNVVTVKSYSWFDGSRGPSWLDQKRAPFHIQQLHNPLDWHKKLGLDRPEGWHTKGAESLASLRELYRQRFHASQKPLDRWIYASPQSIPLDENVEFVDPWDQDFLELLRHRDEHEPLGRANFHYLACPTSFLCGVWRVTGPALLHFSTEPLPENNTASRESRRRYRKPVYEPVSVRVFELPLSEPVIPGVFPSRFEQMRAITASDSGFRTSKPPHSDFHQMIGQCKRVSRRLEREYPWTYGVLVKVEDKWIKFWAMEETALILGARTLSTLLSAVPIVLGNRWWGDISRRFRNSTEENGGTVSAETDPIAQTLQHVLDILGDEHKEKFRQTTAGRNLLERIESRLENEEWNTSDQVLREIADAMGVDMNGQLKDRG
ncbi:hypothetical protein BHE90_009739 [Fusarium euwallaceae]|uniref:Uncharacterized protein n=2 Tax=Fusarium solani species complex TaxID=232080 RepID=A0A430LJ80_9HYPO|nr:hypothetical protein CEP51_007582 [Fusarium floridanum]RTE75799.1 hypothetical protein BHE90_009739 [Fusarium euwallaceae]